MNNKWSEAQVNSRPESFWTISVYKKEFCYLMQLTMDECLTRLYRLQPTLTVSITQEPNQAQFEICIKRYDQRLRFEYNSAVATGMVISSSEHPEMMIIQGIVRHEVVFWLYTFVLAMFTFMTIFTGELIFALLGLALCFVFIRRDYNDYRKLDTLIHDTFTEAEKHTHST